MDLVYNVHSNHGWQGQEISYKAAHSFSEAVHYAQIFTKDPEFKNINILVQDYDIRGVKTVFDATAEVLKRC